MSLCQKVPIAQISTCVTDSSSPGCKNTAGQTNTATDKSCISTQSGTSDHYQKMCYYMNITSREAGAYATNLLFCIFVQPQAIYCLHVNPFETH